MMSSNYYDASCFSEPEMAKVVAALCNLPWGGIVVAGDTFFSIPKQAVWAPGWAMLRITVPLREPDPVGRVD